jgi:hypothetical protein
MASEGVWFSLKMLFTDPIARCSIRYIRLMPPAWPIGSIKVVEVAVAWLLQCPIFYWMLA